MQFVLEFTALSAQEMDALLRRDWTAEEVYNHLTDELQPRTFDETLRALYPGDDLQKRLTDAIHKMEGGSRDSVRKKVGDWLAGRYAPTRRQDLIKICFALGFLEPQANLLLAMTTDGPFHLRNPQELTLAYALRTGKDYTQAMALAQSLPPLPEITEPDAAGSLTKPIADAFAQVSDDDAFLRFYQEHLHALGTLHNTAYQEFSRLLDLLISPTFSYAEREAALSVQQVVERYLRMNLKLDKKTSQYGALQKALRKFWPNTTSITRMKSRQEDVNRRTLLLLYLVTDGGLDAESDAGDDQLTIYDAALEATPLDRFEVHYWKLKSMLGDCGMSPPDPRNVFDWLVLYSLRTEADEMPDERMQAVLDVVFQADAPQEDPEETT